MGKVQARAIMSLEGYVAKQDNTIGRIFDWLQNGEVALPTPARDFEVYLTQPLFSIVAFIAFIAVTA